MRTSLLLVGLLSTPALAGTTPVNLTADRDYVLTLAQGSSANVTDPAGNVVASMTWQGDPFGVEFRAQYTATYFLNTPDEEGLYAYVTLDCASSVKTHCTISPNHAKTATLWWTGATDWRRIKLVGGYTYDAVVTEQYGEDVYAYIIADGQRHPLPYKAQSTGIYYLELLCDNLDGGCVYSVTVRVVPTRRHH